jgi:hypothetical protein
MTSLQKDFEICIIPIIRSHKCEICTLSYKPNRKHIYEKLLLRLEEKLEKDSQMLDKAQTEKTEISWG